MCACVYILYISCTSMSVDVCAVSRTQEHVLWVICMNAVVVFLFGKLPALVRPATHLVLYVDHWMCCGCSRVCAVSEETCPP